HASSPDVFEAARTHLAYGSRLRRSRQRLRARSELRLAIDMFDRVGAAPWSEITRAELSATGERVAKRDVSSMTKLTPQELQIAIHLAQRRTTRETAAALFLSPKTVEYHLRSVYRKLGIASREELAALRLSALEEAGEGSKEGLHPG
ncbi:MAG: response regulator transcription factor, partial [Acidimicrobiales bacterium]